MNLRKDALAICKAALRAADPEEALLRHAPEHALAQHALAQSLRGCALRLGRHRAPLGDGARREPRPEHQGPAGEEQAHAAALGGEGVPPREGSGRVAVLHHLQRTPHRLLATHDLGHGRAPRRQARGQLAVERPHDHAAADRVLAILLGRRNGRRR